MQITWPCHCNTLQRTAERCMTNVTSGCESRVKTLQDAATQHTATHCQHIANTLQHTATHCSKPSSKTPQHTATYYNTLPHAATHCNALERITWPDIVLVRGLQRVEYQIKYKSTDVFERSYHMSAKMVSSDFITW